MKNLLCAAALATTTTLTSGVWAQVTAGSEEVLNEAPLVATKREGPVEDTTELSLQGGALTAGGNAQTAALTGGTRFFKRFGPSEITNNNQVNYARTGTEEGGMETTVENYQARLRYEYFFNNHLSAFLAVQARRDEFQGLNLRMNIDPGMAYYFVRNEATRLWLEAGYDLQYEERTQEVVDTGIAEGTPIDKSLVEHNARFYLGYDQKLDDRLHLVSGLELFKSLELEEAWRLNWDTSLNLSVIDDFSLAIGSTTFYNNNPLPGVKRLDVISSLSFVYRLM